MKYIVTKQENVIEEIFIFPDSVHHRDMAEAVQYLKEHDRLIYGKWRRIEREPISAGFVRGGKCEGNSESLGLRSRPEDTALLPWMNGMDERARTPASATTERWETFRQDSPDRWCVRKGRIVSDLKFFNIQDAGELAEILNEKDEAISSCEKIMDAIAGHTDWHPSPHVDEDNWNEEAHVEPTITVADCRALKEVLRKAGKLEQYMP